MSRSILGMPTFHEPCSSLHQGEEQPDAELFLWVVPFLYIMLLVGVVGGKEENCGWRGEREEMRKIDQSSIIGRSFSYFIYVVAIIPYRLLWYFFVFCLLYTFLESMM